MTISSTTRQAGPYAGNDVTTAFPFAFKVFYAADLLVVLTDAEGVETTQVLTTNYSVALNADQNAAPGGTVTMVSAPATGESLVVTSDLSALQPVNLTNAGGFYPRVINDALDRLTILIQQLFNTAARAVLVPLGESTFILPAAAARRSMLLGFDSSDEALPIAVASQASGSIGSGLEFGPYVGDGSDTTFSMAETVAAGMEWTVDVFVAGVLQPANTYACNGTTTLTFSAAPAIGAVIEGIHTGGSIGFTAALPSVRAVPGGNLYSIPTRFARYPDLADHPLVLKDGAADDGPGVAAAFAAQDRWTHFGGTIRIGSDTTIPVGSVLDVANGQVYVAAGKILTVNGAVNAPLDRQIFTGPGAVRGIPKVTAEWFGAVGDWDESQPDGGSYTDNTAAFQAAVDCIAAAAVAPGRNHLPVVRLLARAYGIGGAVTLAPVLNAPCSLEGSGWSPDGSGSRIYSAGGAGQIKVVGTYGLANSNCNAEFAIRDLHILASDNAAPIGLQIEGGGGVDNLVVTGLTNNMLENLSVSDFAKNCTIRSATKLWLRRCYFNSGTVFGTSLELGVSTGGTVTADIILDGVVLGQPGAGAGGGKALAIVNSDISGASASLAEVRGITMSNDCQLYAGTAGYCIHVFAQGAVGKTKTFGDMTLSPGTKLQGAADGSSISAVYVEAKDGALASTINLFPGQVEYFAEKAFDFRSTATVATFGDISDVKIKGVTFRYNINESISVDGAAGVQIVGNNYQYCGGTVVTATAHILLNNVRAGRVENNLASHKDAVSWPGLDTGVRLTGGATTNVYSRANALGTATAYSEHAAVTDANTKDSTDQPSLTVQV